MKVNSEWKRSVRSYLKFSKSDRNGIIVLTFLIIISLIVLVVIKNSTQPHSNLDHEKIDAALAQIEREKELNKAKRKLFTFNPNSIEPSQLDSLQLPNYIKNNLIKYRRAGGIIKTSKDFRKVYGMNDSIFKVIEPYIIIDNQIYTAQKQSDNKKSIYRNNNIKEEKQKNFNHNKPKHKLEKAFTVELNMSTKEDLMRISGIGDVFSSRIIKYRSILGGYVNKEQLLEVYGLSDTIYYKIEKFIDVDDQKIKKIRLNFADYKTLLRHPYLQKKDVSAIINYKTKHGPYKTKSELLDNKILDEEVYNKIYPYITIE